MFAQAEKKKLRYALLNHRRALTPSQVKDYSQNICKRIITQPTFKKAIHIGIYMNKDNEVDVSTLLSLPNKHFYLPVLKTDWTLEFHSYQLDDPCYLNSWGIREPYQQQQSIPAHQLDMMILPMVGFTQTGQRLGMGKACYDRSFRTKPTPFLLGVAFAFQELEQIPVEPHDLIMNLIITEKKTIHPIPKSC